MSNSLTEHDGEAITAAITILNAAGYRVDQVGKGSKYRDGVEFRVDVKAPCHTQFFEPTVEAALDAIEDLPEFDMAGDLVSDSGDDELVPDGGYTRAEREAVRVVQEVENANASLPAESLISGRVADRLECSRQHAYEAVRNATEAGLLRRIPDPEGKRVERHCTTDVGQRVLEDGDELVVRRTIEPGTGGADDGEDGNIRADGGQQTKTVSELRDEIRDLLDIPDYRRGAQGFKSRTFKKAVEALGAPTWGGIPSLRGILRDELDLTDDHRDTSPLRKAELQALRDALREAADGGSDRSEDASQDGEGPPGWITTSGSVWEASVEFDGETHVSACGIEFDEWGQWQEERPQPSESYGVCADCLEELGL